MRSRIIKDPQPPVPGSIGQGDRVQFRLHDDDAERYGTVLDVLSTQFVIQDDNNTTHITHFRHVLPVIRSALP